jgi:hypothetical protein
LAVSSWEATGEEWECPDAIGAEERSDEATIASGARLETDPPPPVSGLTATNGETDRPSRFLKVGRYIPRVLALDEVVRR